MIKRALLGEGSVECTYYNDDYESEGGLYVKNGKMRADGYYEEERIITVVTNEAMYIWNYDQPEGGGMKMNVGPVEDWEEREEGFIPEEEIECEYKQIDDSIFDIPEDVEFSGLIDSLMDLEFEDFSNPQ